MYSVFLSYAPLQEYLSILLEKGLIEEYQKRTGRKRKRKTTTIFLLLL
jgi:predicted transcriptional regulator